MAFFFVITHGKMFGIWKPSSNGLRQAGRSTGRQYGLFLRARLYYFILPDMVHVYFLAFVIVRGSSNGIFFHIAYKKILPYS
jgi:hypothetical protein